ncbi:serine--tRNA ligase [Candidatus Woesearchaeota archaeon]|nr:serine--tRNA ligase [Candidatus Woesearchaeota archaeon]
MLDIKFIKENISDVKKDLQKRGEKEKVGLVYELVKKNDEFNELRESNEKLRHKRNLITREINELRKEGRDIKAKVKEAQELPSKIEASDSKLHELEQRMQEILQQIPNVLHSSVPAGKDETENKQVRVWGKPKKLVDIHSHGEILEDKGLADFKRAAKISGAGFHFLKGDLVKLSLALINFATSELEKKGFTLIEPPYMMRKQPYSAVTEMHAFQDVMYKIEGEDSYLIATSEHPIAAMHMDETFKEEDLPIKYCGVSTNFRKEIGSHGVDTRGLFRVHQFSKVEMFVFSKQKESWKMHEELLATAEALVRKLKIPYQVVNVCSGDIGMIAAKKYDINAWFPRQNKYGEIISCSNCTSYQAASLNIKYEKSSGEKEHAHTLNSTAIAVGRMLVAITENYQNKDGSISVPLALQKYMGKKVIGK